jgi:nitric oxide reductase activation protein
VTRPTRFASVVVVALALAGSATAQTNATPAKKELVQHLLRLQQSDLEAFARSVVERPAAQMMRQAGLALQQQTAPEKRDAAAKAIEAEVRKYVDDAYPIVRERALKLAPSTIGAAFESKLSEDELKQLVAWLESPLAKKYQQIGADMRDSFSQKLLAEMPAVLDPKLHALDDRIRAILGLPPGAPAPGPGASSARPPGK